MKLVIRRTIPAALLCLAASACASRTPTPEPEPAMVSARLDTRPVQVTPGDCSEALRMAQAEPDMDVDKVPEPIAMKPAPIDTRKMPRGVADRNGYYNVKFRVLVDTLGKPDMKTFTVVEASNAWLGTSVKKAVAKWSFKPAEVSGCKVPRNYSLGISPRGKTPAAPAKAATKATTSTKKPAAKTAAKSSKPPTKAKPPVAAKPPATTPPPVKKPPLS
jgi:hypothetical protein